MRIRRNSGEIDEKGYSSRVKDRERGSFAGAYGVRNDGKKTSVNSRDRGIKDDILARSMYSSLELVTVGWLRKFR